MSLKKVLSFLLVYLIVIIAGSFALNFLQEFLLGEYSFAVAIVIGIFVGLCSGELVRKAKSNK